MKFDSSVILGQSGVSLPTAIAIQTPNPECLPFALCAAALHNEGVTFFNK